MYSFVHHMVWFGRKGYIRSHSFTLQFLKNEVSADAALTTLSDFKNTTSAGIVQAVSDNGVENFAGGVGGPPGGYVGVLPYEMTNLFRTGVTSITCSLFGGDYARARYVFVVKNQEAEPKGRPVWDVKRYAVAYDAKSGEISHVHEVWGDAAFVKKNDAGKLLRRFSGKVKSLKVLTAPEDFSAEPGTEFLVDVKKQILKPLAR